MNNTRRFSPESILLLAGLVLLAFTILHSIFAPLAWSLLIVLGAAVLGTDIIRQWLASCREQ